MRTNPPRAVFPPGTEAAADALKLSPGIVSGEHLFLTGITGSAPDGQMPSDAAEQFHGCFRKIGAVLEAAGMDYSALVEMTTYHLELQTTFDLFAEVRAQYVRKPYPAWTALEVAGLRRAGALVEIRAIASVAGTKN